MQVIGKIKVKNETQDVSASFKKRELVVTTDEQYPQMILIEFVQDKCDLLNAYEVGQNVKVSINLRGREWLNPQGEAKYFNSIQGWRIEPNADNVPVNAQQVANQAASNLNGEPDDLPF